MCFDFSCWTILTSQAHQNHVCKSFLKIISNKVLKKIVIEQLCVCVFIVKEGCCTLAWGPEKYGSAKA